MLQERGLIELMLNRDKITTPTQYPFNIPALRNLSTLNFHPKVTYLSGENGMGKSTLIEAIAVCSGFNAEGGTKNFNFATRASHSELHQYIKIAKAPVRFKDGFFLRSESFYNVATNIEQIDDGKMTARLGGTPLHELSHGESFWALFMNRFSGESLFILDEPEAALSPMRQMGMLTRMHELIEQGCQFIIATHSPIVMAYPDSIIYEMGEKGLRKARYEETENYKVFRQFLNDHEMMVKILLGKD